MSDKYQWLEESNSCMTKEWIAQQNAQSASLFQNAVEFDEIQAHLATAMSRVGKFNRIFLGADKLYTIAFTDENSQGALLRTDLSNISNDITKWEFVIEAQHFTNSQDARLQFTKIDFCPFDSTRCLLHLSEGGQDQSTTIEFDLEKKEVIEGGFFIKKSVNYTSWIDKDSGVVAQIKFLVSLALTIGANSMFFYISAYRGG